MAQAMLRLLARPKITAVFFVSVIAAPVVCEVRLYVVGGASEKPAARILLTAGQAGALKTGGLCGHGAQRAAPLHDRAGILRIVAADGKTAGRMPALPKASRRGAARCGGRRVRFLLRSSGGRRGGREGSSWGNRFWREWRGATPFLFGRAAC